MAQNFIPKIQYAVNALTGTTATSSTTVSALSSTTNLRAGMKVVGTGIPVGATIASITNSTDIVLSAAATATATGVSLEFYFEFTFTYPATEDDGEREKSTVKVSASLSGLQQVQHQYTEGLRDITYRFLTSSEITSLKYFYENYGRLGELFRYFDHATETGYNTYELDNYDFKPRRILPKAGDFLYELNLRFRRVIA